eukprot:5603482-Amphidinium_carterae.2
MILALAECFTARWSCRGQRSESCFAALLQAESNHTRLSFLIAVFSNILIESRDPSLQSSLKVVHKSTGASSGTSASNANIRVT